MGGYKLFTVLAAAVLVCGAAAVLPVAWLGADSLESSYREYAVRDMTANAHLIALAAAPLVEKGDETGLADLLRRARSGSDTRFTIVDAAGAVAADTDEASDRMENHLNRPEIRAALAGRSGLEMRKSPTLGTEWIYVAIPFRGDMAIRAAASLDGVNARLSGWWHRVLAGVAFSLLALLLLALLVARLLSRPIEMAAAGAERYARGDFSYRLPAVGSAEMRRLNASLGAMAGELDSRFRVILRQREEMRTVFENMSEGIFAVDAGGRIMLVNGAAENLLGFDADVTGREVETVVRHADLLELLKAAGAAEAPVEREFSVPASGNGDRLLFTHAARIREEGGDLGVLVVLRDVTRLRQLETMRRDFVANVSHELRTPVTAVQGCLETLAESGNCEGEEVRQFLDIALKNTRRMGAIISNLLLLAGMESGEERRASAPSCNAILPVVDEALAVCREAADARNVDFQVDCDPELVASMDARLIVHALTNLVDNAIKYGPEGGTISVTAGESDGKIRITVSDRGPGIAPRYQSRVFERFYRIDGSSRLREGSGLGLALVKHIAMSQGGDITLESTIGAGSSFSLFLPKYTGEDA